MWILINKLKLTTVISKVSFNVDISVCRRCKKSDQSFRNVQ
jgi:hypothetical protein